MLTCGGADIVADAERDLNRQTDGFATSFAAQARRLLRLHRIEGILICSNAKGGEMLHDGILSINIPRWWDTKQSWRFHLSRIVHGIKLARYAKRNGVDLAVIDSGTAHYFSLAAFKLAGIPVAVNFHNVRWPIGYEPSGSVKRLVRKLDSWFFRNVAIGALGCSPECSNQARADGAGNLPFFPWSGQFIAEGFNSALNPHEASLPFRLLFAGRVERNKGVFDLLTVASSLKGRTGRQIVVEFCGDGTALDELRHEIGRLELSGMVTARGRLSPSELAEAYARCDALILPTRGDFCEGMPLVAAEAVLSGKPVITSRLSNALPVMGGAIAEAEPENIQSYVNVIAAMADDPEIYERHQRECDQVSRQFLDRSQSFAAALDRLIETVRPRHELLRDYDIIFAA